MGTTQGLAPRQIIDTPEAYVEAIKTGVVAEVSPLLYGTITNPSFGTLTNTIRSKAWVSSSANLYNVLVLNQRAIGNQKDASSLNLDAVVSQRTIDGLGRIVGLTQTGNQAITTPLLVFQEKGGSSILGPAAVPNFANFGELVNSYRPSGSKAMPEAVLKGLRQGYGRISATGSQTPFDAYSAFSGLTTWRQINLGANTITTPVTDPRKEISDRGQYATYQTALKAISPSGTSAGMAADTKAFFENFATPLINARSSRATHNQLQIGLRALLFLSYSASPLWSCFGIGYRNNANPLIGLPTSQLSGEGIYAGQEFQINNTVWRDNPSIATKLIGSGAPAGTQSGSYLDEGWFRMDPAVSIGAGITAPAQLPKSLNDYRWQATVASTGAIVIFDPTSVSSDTLDASGIKRSTRMLSPTSIYDRGNGQSLASRGTLMSQILPKQFALYIDSAGGIDKITGSRFADVIIGAPDTAAHGQLMANGGGGDDLISPGRGGSLVYLGHGRDRLVIEATDLFGQAILMDFNIDQDKLVVAKSVSISGLGTSTLTLGNAADPLANKTLVLSGTSSAIWQAGAIQQM